MSASAHLGIVLTTAILVEVYALFRYYNWVDARSINPEWLRTWIPTFVAAIGLCFMLYQQTGWSVLTFLICLAVTLGLSLTILLAEPNNSQGTPDPTKMDQEDIMKIEMGSIGAVGVIALIALIVINWPKK